MLRHKTKYFHTGVYYAIFSTSHLFIFLCERFCVAAKWSALMECVRFAGALFLSSLHN